MRRRALHEAMFRRFVAPETEPGSYPQARLHTQWPGGAATGDLARVHSDMRRCAAALLDRIGPAVLMTHSAGGPFGWLAADERPSLVRAIVAVEPQKPAFAEGSGGVLAWG